MTKIYYVANSRMPTIKAYGLQIVKMCEAFTKAGFECELIIPRRYRYEGIEEGGILEYYNVKTPFRIVELRSLDLIYINLGTFLNKILFWVQQLSFALSVKKYLAGKHGIIYSRDQFALGVLNGSKHKLFWEAHNLPKNIDSKFYKKILNKISGLIVISNGLQEDFAKNYHKEILVAPDGVDLAEFAIDINKEKAREELFGFHRDSYKRKKIAVYVGHLYPWKGTDIFLKTAEYLSRKNANYLICIFGGIETGIAEFPITLDLHPNLPMFLGRIAHKQVTIILKAADCAVLTGKKSETISEKYTSPLKLFEYMASGCPIVAQDLPSFREVLNDDNSFLVKPDNAKALADGIIEVFENEGLAKEKAAKALEDVKRYTWDQRAKTIYNFLNLDYK